MLTMKKAQRIWKIETEAGFRMSSLEGELTSLIVRSIFDIKRATVVALLSAARVADVVGLLAASKLARDLVTIVVGLNAILHDLWLLQHRRDDGSTRPLPLCLEQVQKVCRDFQGSERRKEMAKEIDQITFLNMYKKREVTNIADRAWRASIGEVLPSMRRTERQKKEDMAQYDAANPV